MPRRIAPPLYARTGDAGVFLTLAIVTIFLIRRRTRRA
jgi:hypothetical protein